MDSFAVSFEDGQDRDQWRLRINTELANLGLHGRWLLNGVRARARVCVLDIM